MAEKSSVIAEIMSLGRPTADSWLTTDCIKQNPENPRVIFRQRDLDKLKKSIYEVGILQPLVVYQDKAKPDEYFLIDGERRWRCAKELNLKQVPTYVHPEPTRIQNITTMFNIHKLRIDWEPMPTAMKLSELISLSGETKNSELARICGMTESQIQLCRKLLFFSDKHQQQVLNHEIKDNFLIEMYPFIIRLRGRFPNLFDEYGVDTIVDLLIEKNKRGHIQAVTEFRDLAKLVTAADRGAPEEDVKNAIRRLLDNPEYEIPSAFESVRALFDIEQLIKRCQHLAEDISVFKPAGVDVESLKAFVGVLNSIMDASRDAKTRINTE